MCVCPLFSAIPDESRQIVVIACLRVNPLCLRVFKSLSHVTLLTLADGDGNNGAVSPAPEMRPGGATPTKRTRNRIRARAPSILVES